MANVAPVPFSNLFSFEAPVTKAAPMVFLFSNDLIVAAPIENAARQAGLGCRTLSPSQSDSLTAETPATILFLDLSAIDNVVELVATIRAEYGSVPIVAFAPHVHVDKLAAAQEAGCDQVLSRGQFHRGAAALIAEAAAR